jgi:molybdate/tungstate transport system substrate-binding protein
MIHRLALVSLALVTLVACGRAPAPAAPATPAPSAVAGTIAVFHAGSLAVPMKALKAAFEAAHPGVTIQLEAAGSRECARKITELNRPCDLMASADYLVIDDLLIPQHAEWNAKFAANEMIIAYREGAKGADRINGTNWHEILLEPGVQYGHSDPNADPCGYRTIMTWQLAEKHYNAPGLAARLDAACPPKNVRPKEVDMLALLEAGEIDYLFIYRSVAEQHGLKYVSLPDEVNLRSPQLAELYRSAKVEVTGSKPGEMTTVIGTPMVYGLTVPKNTANRAAGEAFAAFILGPEGRAIIKANGQPVLDPPLVAGFANAPEAIRAVARAE